MLDTILTPLEAASLSPESRARLQTWGIACYVQGVEACKGRALTGLEQADAETDAQALAQLGHLGVPASRWFSRRQPAEGEFGGCS